jgi:hypothetical protein
VNEIYINSVKEGLKEAVRLALIAVVPLVIAQLSQGGSLDVRTIVIVGVIAVLRGVEKYLYVEGKETGDMNKVSEILKLE